MPKTLIARWGRTVPILALAAACLPAPAAAVLSPWATNPQGEVRLVSPWRIAPRQGELRLGLQFRMAPGWHVYWTNSGDAGYAPVVAFGRPPGLSYPRLLWPAPHRFELPGGLEAFGYAGEAVYPIQAVLGAGAAAAGGPLHLTADVDYLTCEVDCVPHRYNLSLEQPVGDPAVADPETSALLDRWWHQLPLPAERQPGVRAAGVIAPDGAGGLRLTFELQGVTAAPGGADLFFETHPALALGRPRVRSSAGGLAFEVPVHRQDSSAPWPAAATLAWTATGLALGGQTLALAGRLEAPVHATAPAAAGDAAPGPAGAGIPAAGGPAPGPAHAAAGSGGSLADRLARGDPRLVAVLAAAAALAALDLWGLLRRRPPAAHPVRREALGFAALLLVCAMLYTLSLEVRPESLAAIELALLAMGLAAWIRGRFRERRQRRLSAEQPAGPQLTPP